jgi:23S rRNA (guanosine2251-2'-O)-methyltransferase
MCASKLRKAKQKLMGSHNRCWLWGRHAVLETIGAGRWPIVELRLSDELSQLQRDEVAALLTTGGDIPVVFEPPQRLTTLCRADDHQGYLAKMRPFPFLSIDELLQDPGERPALCLLDGIQDPHNFGAIIRSAEVLGMDGVIVGASRQSEVTAIVARSSAGAVNHLPLAQTDDLLQAALRLRAECGCRLIAADHRAERSPSHEDWTGPTVIIIGNESVGVSDSLREACDAAVRIPQPGRTESLNAAVAAGILFYEIRRQRDAG